MVSRLSYSLAVFLLLLFPIIGFCYYDDDSSYYDNDLSYRGNSYGYDDGYNEPTYRQRPRAYSYNSKRRVRHKETSDGGSSGSGRMPSQISASGEKVIIINPRVHAWGAYSPAGVLLRSGTATAGNSYCPDIHRSCRTKVGTFRIYSLGSRSCKSTRYPLPRGGAPMPYCMFFNKNQGLHGSYEVVNANVSHGCVRVRVADAEWIRFNFANVGTKVKVLPY